MTNIALTAGFTQPGQPRGDSLRESAHRPNSQVAAVLELPLPQALRLLAGITGGRRGRKLQACAAAITSGSLATDAARQLGLEPSALDAVELAQSGGHGEAAIKACAEIAEFDARSTRRLFERLSYTFILAGAALLGMFAISAIAVERMRAIFESFGVELPGLTVLVFFWSKLIVKYPLVWVGALLMATAGAFLAILHPVPRRIAREMFHWCPYIGSIVESAARARATIALSRLVGSGAPAPLAVSVAAKLCGLSSVRKSLNRLCWCLEAGTPPGGNDPEMLLLALPLFESRDTTTAARELRTLADLHTGRNEALANVLPYFFEPAAVLIVGITVGFTVIALFMPLVKLLNDLS